ncbi:MAG: deoxyribodipyrimidine photo-lyase [Lentisphaeria bacterium]|nr:deoxyribodipyrimidine photo-lyase [Lentisphaeria bacterium]
MAELWPYVPHCATSEVSMIAPERIEWPRPGAPETGRRYVLYWMQQSQRSRCNHALEFALEQANGLRLPLLTVFALAPAFPDAGRAAYRFLLQGLAEVAPDLGARGIGFVVRRGNPADVVAPLAADAALLVTDRGYLRLQRVWRREVARVVSCPVVEVESDVVVPVAAACPKEAYSAAVLRPRIRRVLPRFLVPLPVGDPAVPWAGPLPAGEDIRGTQRLLDSLDLSGSWPRHAPPGGARAALAHLGAFLRDRLREYGSGRNEVGTDVTSHLSPYLHFGQIAALEIALAVRDAPAAPEAGEAFLEELIVRRELAANFVHFHSGYDTYESLPEWSRRTLEAHRRDPRPYLYSPERLAGADTHDPWWNAAQTELLRTGRMHPYMRMYWGKKVLEWSPTPEDAYHTALDLNNRFELDGRDANGFAGVAWCFGKHDRPWQGRPVFGTVRTMTDRGLERKFDMPAYARRIDALA